MWQTGIANIIQHGKVDFASAKRSREMVESGELLAKGGLYFISPTINELSIPELLTLTADENWVDDYC